MLADQGWVRHTPGKKMAGIRGRKRKDTCEKAFPVELWIVGSVGVDLRASRAGANGEKGRGYDCVYGERNDGATQARYGSVC